MHGAREPTCPAGSPAAWREVWFKCGDRLSDQHSVPVMVKDDTSSCNPGRDVALGGSQECSVSAEVQRDSSALGQQLFDRQK